MFVNVRERADQTVAVRRSEERRRDGSWIRRPVDEEERFRRRLDICSLKVILNSQINCGLAICRSVYYAATDVVILRFMIEVCWAPMLAAFSVPLDQSDDEVVIALCLEGIRYAIHVTAVMSMKTHRDAFVTSVAKFTSLHAPADIKQKNIDAIKAILTIADEDGNYLQEAWEHILTCVSRFEHLHLLGEGRPPAATFFAFPKMTLKS
ncbi:brefeldin A-inhibited guanine nucleotide-exchange protein [Salix suchowensis]|nr:brefeldin A-inhibited guanine nucleotide-exchange protein [Salix suchowensis]